MKFTVTPLGGARNDVGRVVDGIVRYLQPKALPCPEPAGPEPRGGVDGPSRYYAHSGEEPGRWLGRGAELANLRGHVERDHFAAVLSGRDPHTGERLISAQGSAGRRAHLGAGTATRTGATGELLYDETDAATALGVTKAEASRMLDVGAAIAIAQVTGTPVDGRAKGRASGRVSMFGQVRGSYLVPIVGENRSRWVTETELSSCQSARDAGIDPDEVRSGGAEDDQIPIAEAAMTR